MKLSFQIGAYALFALLLLGFSTEAIEMAQKSMLLANAHQIRTALELYHLDHHAYPDSLEDLIPNYLEVPESADIKKLKYAQAAAGASYSLASE